MVDEGTVLDNSEIHSPSNLVGLSIGRLNLWLDPQQHDLKTTLPPTHEKFLHLGENISPAEGDLCLKITGNTLPSSHERGALICKTRIWELWQNQSGDYVFIAPQGSHTKRAVINSHFQNGVVYSAVPAMLKSGTYPLQSLDNIIFVNWLGTFADIILHASGAVINGEGYAFIGPAGAGKSTLANALQQAVPAAILGEDQVILRFLDQHFWIYGSPWHENPAMCSAGGAPLVKLFYLDRDPNKPHSCTRLKPAEAVQRILQTAFIPYYRQDLLPGILDQLARLAEQLPCYTLNYRLGADPWNLVKSC